MKHVLFTTVRSTEIDSLGHVNNAKYLEYMEWGRVEWLTETGLTMDVLRRLGILPVVANININYRRELRLGQRVKIVSKLSQIGNKSFVVRHELYNEREELVSDADVTMVMIDAKERRAIPLPDEFVRLFANGDA